jgi:hypothetical protein
MPRERATAFLGARFAGARLRPVAGRGFAMTASWIEADSAPKPVIVQSAPCVMLGQGDMYEA